MQYSPAEIKSYKYKDFVQVPNGFLDNLCEYNKFYHLKIMCWLLYANSDSSTGIYDNCGFPNSTSLKNNLAYALQYKHIYPDHDKKEYVLNKDMFYKSDNGSGYYKSLLFTMIPNRFFEEDLKDIESLAELKILLFIFRNTNGWHQDDCKFSINKICSMLKMSKTTAVKGIADNEKVGRIVPVKSSARNKSNSYALHTSQTLELMEKPDEVVVVSKVKESKVSEAREYDYYFNDMGFNYPTKRRFENSWRNATPEKFTYQHVLDAWIELCYVKKHGKQPTRQKEWIIFNKIIGAIKRRGYSAAQFKWAFGFVRNTVMADKKRDPSSVEFFEIADYIGNAPEDLK